MSNLFNLANDMQQLQLMITDEEITFEEIKDTLDSIEMAFEDKADNIRYLELSIDADIEALEKRKKQIDERIKSMKNRKSSLKEYLLQAMLLAAKRKFKTAEFTYYIRSNAPQLNKEVLDITKVPKDYLIEQEPKLDSKKLLADVKAGLEIPTAEIKVTESLVIK